MRAIFQAFDQFSEKVLPAVGDNHISEDQPIPHFASKMPRFGHPAVGKYVMHFDRSYHSFVRSLRRFSATCAREKSHTRSCAISTSKAPSGKTTTCTTAVNLCIACAICSFSSAPPALSSFFFQYVFTFFGKCSLPLVESTFLQINPKHFTSKLPLVGPP